MNLREAAEMALGVLLDPTTRADEVADAVKTIRQALAQPEQEPFIYVREDNERPFGGYEHCSEADAGAFPVYTAPPKKEWVGLTDEEVDALADEHLVAVQEYIGMGEYISSIDGEVEFARAIEAKLKEKNG